MKFLTDKDVIRIINEEWNKRLECFIETLDVTTKVDVDKDGEKEIVISPELKVIHKKSGFRYTVDSVGPRSVILRTPENETFIVDNETLEKEYEL
jgi:hypothetical protein